MDEENQSGQGEVLPPVWQQTDLFSQLSSVLCQDLADTLEASAPLRAQAQQAKQLALQQQRALDLAREKGDSPIPQQIEEGNGGNKNDKKMGNGGNGSGVKKRGSLALSKLAKSLSMLR